MSRLPAIAAVGSGTIGSTPLQIQIDMLQRLLPTLPAGASVFIVSVTLPGPGAAVPTVLEDPSVISGADSASAAPEPCAIEIPAAPSKNWTPLNRAAEERRRDPDKLEKPSVWAGRLGVSARALSRAIACGALHHETKRDGKDHGAKIIAPAALEAFLANVEAVKSGQCDAPKWWVPVFGKRAWASRTSRRGRVG